MGNRADLQTLLETVLGSGNVYFQPPESFKMSYPCIRYVRNSEKIRFADDQLYNSMKEYQIIVIDKDPDSDILDKIANLPLCSFERHYTADNLNHDVYNLYY